MRDAYTACAPQHLGNSPQIEEVQDSSNFSILRIHNYSSHPQAHLHDLDVGSRYFLFNLDWV